MNLLREGLDLPEVSLVAILDADKEGFLRSETSLMQTIGRAARNVNAKVILYADKVTDAMQRTIDETTRRRRAAGGVQQGARHHAGDDQEGDLCRASSRQAAAHAEANAKVGRTDETQYITEEYIAELEGEMFAAAEAMEFERAASIRDRIGKMRDQIGKPVDRRCRRRTARQEATRREKKRRRRSSPVERPRAAAETERVSNSTAF